MINEIGHIDELTGRVCVSAISYDERYSAWLYYEGCEKKARGSWRPIAKLEFKENGRYRVEFADGTWREMLPTDHIYVTGQRGLI